MKSLRSRTKDLIPPSIYVRLNAWRHYFQGEAELKLLKKLCDPKSISIDVGAHSGIYTYFLRRYSKHCLAFEPVPLLHVFLKSAFKSGVSVSNSVLSDKKENVSLRVPSIKGVLNYGLATIESDNALFNSPVEQINVQAHRLDDLEIKETVGLIKVDVEGHELAVLLGGGKLLRRDHPVLVTEIEERHCAHSFERVEKYLSQMDYKGFFILDGQITPIDKFDLKIHQAVGNVEKDQRIKGRTYINNFIWLHGLRNNADLFA